MQDVSIPSALSEALAAKGYTELTPVQQAVLESAAEGKDLLVSAQTGSGKTVAYGIAVAPTLLGDAVRFDKAAKPLALVVTPTRELAQQVERELGWLYARTGARIISCVGGTDVRREQRQLMQGAHVVVGTPGRLCDHIERGALDLSEVRAVVLDEADEMLDLGFRDELECMLDKAPGTRRTLLFSATLPPAITGLARRYQRDALRIALTVDSEPHGDIEYRALLVAPHEREHAVVNVLRFYEARGALVFCATRERVKQLYGNLLERGFSVVTLSGEMSQPERTRALQTVRDGRARVCVATDVAARGLDLPDLGLVVHADLPQNPDLVLHRSGRTGRAGRKGTCVILVPYPARRYAERLIASAKVRAKWGPAPSAEEIRAKDHQRIIGELGALEEASEEDLAVARELCTTRPAEQLVAALVRFQRGLLPAPEELTAPLIAPAATPARRQDGPKQAVWFSLNVGRTDNADPRWIVPFLCRRGHITRAEIGKIRIFDEQTRFEIAEGAAEKFAAAARRPDPQDPNIRIERAAPDRGPPHTRNGPPPRRRPPADAPRRRVVPDAPTSKPRRVPAAADSRARARRPK